MHESHISHNHVTLDLLIPCMQSHQIVYHNNCYIIIIIIIS